MRTLNEFSWREAFNDNNGKTNIRIISGFIIIIVSCIVFLYSAYTKYNDGLLTSAAFAVTGSGLLSLSRLTKDQPIKLD